jgi:hypothetical protein
LAGHDFSDFKSVLKSLKSFGISYSQTAYMNDWAHPDPVLELSEKRTEPEASLERTEGGIRNSQAQD